VRQGRGSDSGGAAITEYAAAQLDLELDDLFLTIGHRFGRDMK
jgi:hypothetical protein